MLWKIRVSLNLPTPSTRFACLFCCMLLHKPGWRKDGCTNSSRNLSNFHVLNAGNLRCNLIVFFLYICSYMQLYAAICMHLRPWSVWISMDMHAFHGYPWIFMDSMDVHGFHGHPWMDSMDIHGFHGYPWSPWISMDSMDIHGIHGYPWSPSMDARGIHGHPWSPWISMDIHGMHAYPWKSIHSMDADACI